MARSPEAVARAKRNYLLRHPDRRKATIKKYYAANREQERTRLKAWQAEHPEKYKAWRAEYRRANRHKDVAYTVKWQAANPTKVRAYKQNTYARRRTAVIGKITVDLPHRLFLLQQGKCAICQSKLTAYHLDHIMPIARGGRNEDDNIQLTCPPCNRSKGSRLPVEYMQSLGKLL